MIQKKNDHVENEGSRSRKGKHARKVDELKEQQPVNKEKEKEFEIKKAKVPLPSVIEAR